MLLNVKTTNFIKLDFEDIFHVSETALWDTFRAKNLKGPKTYEKENFGNSSVPFDGTPSCGCLPEDT